MTAVDISAGMLAAAQRRLGDRPGISWRQQDMLRFLQQRPDSGEALVLSTWALGYSHHRVAFAVPDTLTDGELQSPKTSSVAFRRAAG